MPKATPPTASASPPPVEILWQIGKPKGGKQEFLQTGGWSQEFNYDVEADSDSVNRPQVPGILSQIRSTKTAKEAATAQLNIHFNLTRNYEEGQLVLLYRRFGSPEDSLFLDGELIQKIPGQKDGKVQSNEIPLKALSKGKHTLSITTAGKSGKHAIDYLKLQASTAKTQPIPQAPITPESAVKPAPEDKPAPTPAPAPVPAPAASDKPQSEETPAPEAKPKTEVKPETEAQRRLLATGLEDYGFWWQQMAKQQSSPKEKKPFRRGRIWS
ncbi:cyanobactin biosynthesis PatC/TenC/TruC family protein [Kamptonema formosum]|uniref:cyanobactin biosynthesis PatC/TenC/TruC family protein n=1 Tax=Kamptonema formosum TaxID=331992 RepID=UPI00034DD062|nr:cyanobactin biosynthesis PatC/TenC/TruC family protein [Oscillatoria sp. PCC 10802]